MTERRYAAFGFVVLIAVALLAPTHAALAQEQSKAEEIASNAWNMLLQGRLEDGLEELDKAIDEDKNHAMAWYYRGFALANLQRMNEAHASFLRAAELGPGWGDAHRMAAVSAVDTGNLDVAWDQAIKAHQAGVDMTQAFQSLQTRSRAPDDLDQQLNAVRVFVGPLNTEKLAARLDNPFTRAVDTGDGPTSTVEVQRGQLVDPRSTSASLATGVGKRLITESQADFFQLLQQTRRSLAASRSFGLVPRQEMARYLLMIEVDELAESGPKRLEGYLKLYDPRSGEEVYRRVLELRNISSRSDLNADLERYVAYLEEWLAQRGR